ncbi:MAG: VanZ family protein [Chitinivibrionales bacterium]|nr:VanZ family protein [Chitinivibrionales bacterium]
MLRNRYLLVTLVTLILISMVYAGLKPKGFRLRNDVSWLSQTNGITFGRTGIAYTDTPLNETYRIGDSLTIDIALTAFQSTHRHHRTIFCILDRKKAILLQIYQWGKSVALRVHHPDGSSAYEVEWPDDLELGSVELLTMVVSLQNGITLYRNGHKVRALKPSLPLPDTAEIGQLILGNSPTAQNPWRGELYMLSVHTTVLSDDEISNRYHQWNESKSLAVLPQTVASYLFDERMGETAHDRSSKIGDVHIPNLFRILQKKILISAWDDFQLSRSFASDSLINLFGFTPFGFFFFALLWNLDGFMKRHRWLLVLSFGGIISLTFELIQVFIPTRCSQSIDLLLNILGTLLGSLLFSKVRRFGVIKKVIGV